jgi:hypothetical protein
LRGLFSTLPRIEFPDGAAWILAEPSNNSNSRGPRQLSDFSLTCFASSYAGLEVGRTHKAKATTKGENKGNRFFMGSET